jgi:hypothetical protein
MNGPAALLVLVAHLALLSAISFGGFPTVLPDVRQLVVDSSRRPVGGEAPYRHCDGAPTRSAYRQ